MSFLKGKDLPVLQLILFILQEAKKYEVKISKTQLVKFLYFADIIFARKHQGKTWTEWKWRYWHYGPYCEEAIKAIQKAKRLGLIATEQTDNEKDFEILVPKSSEEVQYSIIPSEIYLLLPELIKKYGGDLSRLLELTYFGSEPMLNAEKGEELDFSTCLSLDQIWAYSRRVPVPPPMSKKKKEILRQKLAELTELRRTREIKKAKKRRKVSPELIDLLNQFDKWCEKV